LAVKKNNSISMDVTIGLDLADVWSDWVAIDRDGEAVRRARVRTTESKLRETFGAMAPAVIAIEVGTHSAWVERVLRSCGHTVVVANARRVALIHRNRRKNNRIDADFLARLARADRKLLFPITHRTEAAQADLLVIRTRDVLVRTRTKLINHVRGMSKSFGVRLPKCSAESFARRAGEEACALSSALALVLEQIAMTNDRIRQLDRQIDAMLRRHPAAERLTQIPGVGALTALAYVLTIEDARRIRRSRSAGAFLGLVPGSDDSGEKHEQRRITKEGDALCRRLLVTAAHYIAGPFGPDSDLRRHALTIAERGGKNARKRAVVAVARKLAVVMHRLWTTEENYVALRHGADATAAA
jgi:transposase